MPKFSKLVPVLIRKFTSQFLWGYYVYISLISFVFLVQIQLRFSALNWNQLIFAFFSTLGLYNLIYIFKTNVYRVPRLILLVVSGCICLHNFLHLSQQVQTLLIPLVFFGGFYQLPPSSSFRGLRYLKGLKIILISLSWFSMIYLMTYISNDQKVDLLYLLFAYLWIFLWCLAFDVRDRKSDLGEIITLATFLDMRSLKILIFVVFIFALCMRFYLGGKFLGVDVFMTCLVFIVNWIAFQRKEKLFYLAIVDGLPILWLLLLFL